MLGFQRALGSLEAKRASQELKALYPIKLRFSKKATRIGPKSSIVSLTKSKIKLKIYFVKFLVAFLENLNFKKKPLCTAWTREIVPSGGLTLILHICSFLVINLL